MKKFFISLIALSLIITCSSAVTVKASGSASDHTVRFENDHVYGGGSSSSDSSDYYHDPGSVNIVDSDPGAPSGTYEITIDGFGANNFSDRDYLLGYLRDRWW